MVKKTFKKYSLVRVVGRSSNGNTVIDVDTLTRRVQVTPLYADSNVKPYRGSGCGLLKCSFPNRTCNECFYKFFNGVVF